MKKLNDGNGWETVSNKLWSQSPDRSFGLSLVISVKLSRLDVKSYRLVKQAM